MSEHFEETVAHHRWIDPQGDSTCTCGWECSPGEFRFEAYTKHLADVLCSVVENTILLVLR